ncbi:uncharacterized protein LOC131640560 [Vicia villosa]|uniref:uncharacterized protein LOC131640560 n=1 Tax=Vicia villosa TaxID=3911 RepID=UPI00273AA331|nr:uncharacterized protein LOC131640560 [Vicia villosa]
MVLSRTISRPAHVWNQSWILLSDGLLHYRRNLANNPDLQLSEVDLQNLTLIEIETLLQASRRSLHDFKLIPYPSDYVLQQLGNRLIYEERLYNIAVIKSEFQSLFTALTKEQRAIYDKIIFAVNNQKGGVFFLHGYGGTVASSGIASLLLPGGRTAHSKFKLPVPTLENSTCNIIFNDDYAELLRQSKLIIWDEAPMAIKFCFEALDKTLTYVMSSYGNSQVIFGGEGRISEPNDGYAEIEIPPELLIQDFDDPIVVIVDSTYPAFMDNYKS